VQQENALRDKRRAANTSQFCQAGEHLAEKEASVFVARRDA
jgi:hypothetical protein